MRTLSVGLAGAVVLLLASTCHAEAEFTGKVVAVIDGDTIVVMRDETAMTVRVAGIECPETGQKFRSDAKRFVSATIAGKSVTVRMRGEDGDGRPIADVLLEGGRRLSHELVRAGLAWHQGDHKTGDSLLPKLEGEARAAGRGIWSEKEPTPPWEWRQKQKQDRAAFFIVPEEKIDRNGNPVRKGVGEKTGLPKEVWHRLTGMEFVLAEPGEFHMGSRLRPKELATKFACKEGVFAGEYPRHVVRIGAPFYLGKYEATQGQWRSVMGTEPWRSRGGRAFIASCPANYITWHEWQDFTDKLSTRQIRFSLPTEAEWEYACRAGTTTIFFFGNDESKLALYAWYGPNAYDVGHAYAHEVGGKKPNPWGLYDMLGNVWEWCLDFHDSDYYQKGPKEDPKGPSGGKKYVMRGGGWWNGYVSLRSAHRAGYGSGCMWRGRFGARVCVRGVKQEHISRTLPLGLGEDPVKGRPHRTGRDGRELVAAKKGSAPPERASRPERQGGEMPTPHVTLKRPGGWKRSQGVTWSGRHQLILSKFESMGSTIRSNDMLEPHLKSHLTKFVKLKGAVVNRRRKELLGTLRFYLIDHEGRELGQFEKERYYVSRDAQTISRISRYKPGVPFYFEVIFEVPKDSKVWGLRIVEELDILGKDRAWLVVRIK